MIIGIPASRNICTSVRYSLIANYRGSTLCCQRSVWLRDLFNLQKYWEFQTHVVTCTDTLIMEYVARIEALCVWRFKLPGLTLKCLELGGSAVNTCNLFFVHWTSNSHALSCSVQSPKSIAVCHAQSLSIRGEATKTTTWPRSETPTHLSASLREKYGTSRGWAEDDYEPDAYWLTY